MLKSPETIKEKFSPFGEKCIQNCYNAYQESDITDFIDNVIIKGHDPQKQQRDEFAQKEILVNYPHVCEKIISHFEGLFLKQDL